jgi:uncharacterized protein YggE
MINFKIFSKENKKIDCSFNILLTVFLAVLIIFTSVSVYNKIKESGYIGQEIESKNTITVSEKGEIYTQPDLATVDFSVISEAKTVSQAVSQNSDKMNKVIDFVKEQGIEDKDLKTTLFNIYPRYEWQERTAIYPQGRRVLVGYEVSQTLEVKIREMTKIGSIIEGAAEAGVNQIGDLGFTVDQPDELKKQAREQAIDKAKKKAKELAEQLGVSLVRITNFNESSETPRIYTAESAFGLGVGGGEAPQIETGQNKIEVTIAITYEIK